MSNGFEPLDGGVALDRAKVENRVEVESAARFRFFFTGLVFAILSFAIQFPIKSTLAVLKVTEALSWVLLAIAGALALVDIGGFSTQPDATHRLTPRFRRYMWLLFAAAVVLLLFSKIAASFAS
jgi:hypothetical protein